LRASILVESPKTTLLIDTSPDLRLQLLQYDITKIDAVLYTHAHADHINGIDDLRPFYVLRERRSLPIYAEKHVLQDITSRFPYLFGEGKGPVILTGQAITGSHVCINDLTATIIPQNHRYSTSFGFRFGTWAYSTDVYDLSEEALHALKGIELWIVGGLSLLESPSHATLERVLSWVDRLRPQRTILTHMNHTMDYDMLRTILPKGVEPGFDGLSINISA
jgi:phosphoribosyl 1,2-cyclic phosphate phosphodiesterase